eukprot:16413-Pyramimonas_sp.AAC.1
MSRPLRPRTTAQYRSELLNGPVPKRTPHEQHLRQPTREVTALQTQHCARSPRATRTLRARAQRT